MNAKSWICCIVAISSLFLVAGTVGCGEDAPSAEQPPAPELKAFPSLELNEKAFTVEQRALALDVSDLAVVGKGKNVDITPETIAQEFGRIVFNLPYLSLTNFDAQGCTDSGTVPESSLAERAESLLARLAASGIKPTSIAVNVEFVKYANGVPNGLIHACIVRRQGQRVVPFGSLALRDHMIEGFRGLAKVKGVTDITVGVALNRFYVPEFDMEIRQADDYANLASLYQEIYAAIKDVNSDIMVGPGFNWSVFKRSVVPEVASQRLAEAAACSSDETVPNSGCPWFMTCNGGKCIEDPEADPKKANDIYAAYERSIRPFLISRSFPNNVPTDTVVADYVALQFVSDDPSGEPFLGVAHPEEPERRAAVQDWYAPIKYLVDTGTGTPLKLVVSQMDWAGNQYAAKADFLKSMKEILSGFQLHWAAWRRSTAVPIACLSDPASGGMICPCGPYQEQGFNEAYCLSGLIPESGVSAQSGQAYKYFIAD